MIPTESTPAASTPTPTKVTAIAYGRAAGLVLAHRLGKWWDTGDNAFVVGVCGFVLFLVASATSFLCFAEDEGPLVLRWFWAVPVGALALALLGGFGAWCVVCVRDAFAWARCLRDEVARKARESRR